MLSETQYVCHKNINLNFVRELHIDQDFEKSEDGRYHVIKAMNGRSRS
jgi:hypothetical protein